MQQQQQQRKIIDLPDSLDPFAVTSGNAAAASAAYAKKAIIRPPEIQETIVPETPIRYVIDSRDRHIERYPDPAHYELALPHEIRNVSSVRLLVADVPFSRYLVHAGNCKIYANVSAPTYDAATHRWSIPEDDYIEISLAQGEYTPTTLAEMLTTALSSASGDAVMVYNMSDSERFRFSRSQGRPLTLSFAGPRVPYGPQSTEQVSVRLADGTYTTETRRYGDSTISYKPGTAARVLGFGPRVYSSQLTGHITADNSTTIHGTGTRFTRELSSGDTLTCYDPTDPTTPVTLTVADVLSDTEFTVPAAVTLAPYSTGFHGKIEAPFRYRLTKDRYIVMKLQNVDTNRGIHPVLDQSFALIHSKETELNNEYEEHYIKRFDPALPSLNKLAISFYDYDGALYDFQNAEHRIELLFTTQSLARRLG